MEKWKQKLHICMLYLGFIVGNKTEYKFFHIQYSLFITQFMGMGKY